jgi:predicted aspartyl protease
VIQGSVNFNREPIIRLTLLGGEDQGEAVEIEAILDTGFNGSLTLPLVTIQALGLPVASSALATLADGSTQELATYRGVVLWEGETRPVTVIAANGNPLAGMSLYYGHDVFIAAVDGGLVRITRRVADSL